MGKRLRTPKNDRAVGRIRKYQLNPVWDEMTARQRAYVEGLESDEDREAYMDSLEDADDADNEV